MIDMTLPPVIAMIIFVIGCLAGARYRHVWKAEGPTWQLWLYGGIAGVAILTVAFIPLAS